MSLKSLMLLLDTKLNFSKIMKKEAVVIPGSFELAMMT